MSGMAPESSPMDDELVERLGRGLAPWEEGIRPDGTKPPIKLSFFERLEARRERRRLKREAKADAKR